MSADVCQRDGWACPCHSLPEPPWPSGKRPALRCPVCDHPDLAIADMHEWQRQREAAEKMEEALR